MSGGGIGQILNAIPYDNPHNKVVICGGTNDLKTDSLNEFVYVVEKATEKLSELASKMHVTMELPHLQHNVPEIKVKGEYLRDMLEKFENTKVFNLQNIKLNQWHHPTTKGTVYNLKPIHEKKEIIMSDCDGDLIPLLRYLGVQLLLKTGCRGCKNLTYTIFLCTDRPENAKGAKTTKIKQD